jgi:ribosomal protein S27AE
MQIRDDIRVIKEFRKRQTRQIIAVAIAIFLVMLMAVVHRRPDIFGEISRQMLFAAQAVFIAVFVGFTAANWKCPACGKHLGGNIHRRLCGKCGARLY